MNDPTDFDPFEPSEADKRVARDLVEQARSGSHPETGHALSREGVAWMIAHAIDTARRDERARIVAKLAELADDYEFHDLIAIGARRNQGAAAIDAARRVIEREGAK